MYYDDEPETRFHQLSMDQTVRQPDLENRLGRHRPVSDWKTVGITAAVVFAVWLFSGYFFGTGLQSPVVRDPHDGQPAYVSERDQKIRERQARERAAREEKQRENDGIFDAGIDFLWHLFK